MLVCVINGRVRVRVRVRVGVGVDVRTCVKCAWIACGMSKTNSLSLSFVQLFL
jgi:hypothetical protein